MSTPWTVHGALYQTWSVHGITQRRITEAGVLRRTERGDIRIVLRGDVSPWSTAAALPPAGWVIAGHDVRRTEEECERITEAGDPRIVE